MLYVAPTGDDIPVDIYAGSHAEFHDNVVTKFEGWLMRYAAMATMGLLEYQQKQGIRGSLFEIGVCGGRYFSVLLRAGWQTSDPVIGLDPCLWVNEEELRKRIGAVLPGPSYQLLKTYSTAYTAQTLQQVFGASPPRFVSVDGSHEAEDVVWDLRLVEETLHPSGIVAVDDFFNTVAIGVNEGVHRFFQSPRGLVPFAMFANKLFLCRSHMREEYMAAIAAYAESDQSEYHPKFFVEHKAAGNLGAIEQKLWGTKFYSLG